MSFEEALNTLSRDDRFRATIYAMNTLLIQKGVYSQREFENLFLEWAQREMRRKVNAGEAESVKPAFT